MAGEVRAVGHAASLHLLTSQFWAEGDKEAQCRLPRYFAQIRKRHRRMRLSGAAGAGGLG